MPSVDSLLAPGRHAEARDGYLDVLGDDDPTGRLPGQRLMASRALPLIYERLWRPVLGRVLMGRDTAAERRFALEALTLSPTDTVLDVGCGPGNITRALAAAARDGLTVGLDASRTMLAQAAREPDDIAYVRGDAADLPFRDGAFDAVCCFAALYLIERPHQALAEIARVLAPGGRVALLASVNRGPLPAVATDAAVRRLSGIRVFDADELTAALRRHGLTGIERRLAGFAQFVSARRP
jgi:SAM-dependent methyltransferase